MTIRSFHIEHFKLSNGTKPSGKGLRRLYKEHKRNAAIARQQENIDRGYYVSKAGDRCTPAPIEDFYPKEVKL